MFASVVVKSRRAEFEALIRKGMVRNLKNAGHILRDAVRDSISVQGFGVPSKPGEPPRLQSGDLWRSYFVAVDPRIMVARVGSPLDYSSKLEAGSLTVAPRPHLRRNLYGNRMVVAALNRPVI